MEINLTDSSDILTIAVMGIALLFQSWRQNLARQRDTDERVRDADKLQKEVREELKAEVDILSAKVAKLEAANTELQESNMNLQENWQEQVKAQAQERTYYRDTIRELRNDSRNFMEITLNAQKQYDAEHEAKVGLEQQNHNLQAAVAGQNQTIGQLQERLDQLTEERTRLLTEIKALKTVAEENIGLKATIKLLEQQRQQMDDEIAKLRRNIAALEKAAAEKPSKPEIIEGHFTAETLPDTPTDGNAA